MVVKDLKVEAEYGDVSLWRSAAVQDDSLELKQCCDIINLAKPESFYDSIASSNNGSIKFWVNRPLRCPFISPVCTQVIALGHVWNGIDAQSDMVFCETMLNGSMTAT